MLQSIEVLGFKQLLEQEKKMKRTASVAGFLHVEAGLCRLELTHAEPSVSPAGSTSHPPMATIMSEIASSAAVHSTKQSLQLRQVQSHVNYIQRSLNLSTGTQGGWNPQAQEMLWTWLAAPKKGSKAKNCFAVHQGQGVVRDREGRED